MNYSLQIQKHFSFLWNQFYHPEQDAPNSPCSEWVKHLNLHKNAKSIDQNEEWNPLSSRSGSLLCISIASLTRRVIADVSRARVSIIRIAYANLGIINFPIGPKRDAGVYSIRSKPSEYSRRVEGRGVVEVCIHHAWPTAVFFRCY